MNIPNWHLPMTTHGVALLSTTSEGVYAAPLMCLTHLSFPKTL